MATSWMPEPEVEARPLRPRAHWVSMPDGQGRSRLTMVWAVPDPLPSGLPTATAVRSSQTR
ncbi:MAG: hypothetical protein U0Q15_19920 [Kineosporiaceae bacterium]